MDNRTKMFASNFPSFFVFQKDCLLLFEKQEMTVIDGFYFGKKEPQTFWKQCVVAMGTERP